MLCIPDWSAFHCVDQTGLRLAMILLPVPLELWDYRYALLHPAQKNPCAVASTWMGHSRL